jgi:hypothetical protein
VDLRSLGQTVWPLRNMYDEVSQSGEPRAIEWIEVCYGGRGEVCNPAAMPATAFVRSLWIEEGGTAVLSGL